MNGLGREASHARLIRKLQASLKSPALFDVFFIEPFNTDPEGDRML